VDVLFKQIGIIHSCFDSQDDTPVQGVFSDACGTVELFPEYAEGLRDIAGFSHVYLIYYFDRAREHVLIQKPFLDGSKGRGIFATRHFNRPNHIGLSIVGLEGVRGNVLDVAGVDVLDGTPLLDIKPYVKQFDHRENVRCGWVDERNLDSISVDRFTPKELRDHDARQER
jgi:tRNA-Thr(GGU) m(6)t(6)A37 methyltransferase TsaA